MPISEPQTHENTPNANGIEQHFKPGRSLHDYARSRINEGDILLGERFLCRGGSLIVVAPSGLGKSTLSIQLAILWACGKPAFDIKPSKSLRILIVQSEDDEGDCIEMAAMMDHLDLNPAEIELVRKNTELIHCNSLTGPKFVGALSGRLQSALDCRDSFDLVIINPYSNYLGGDVADTELNLKFLHELLNPVLEKFKIAVIPICHSPKTPYMNFNKFNPWDFQYAAAGCAAIANWTRSMLVVIPIKAQEKLFKFVAAKRGARIGDAWEGKLERYFQHSTVPGLLRWEPASQEQKKSVQREKAKAKKTYTTREVVMKCLDLIEWKNRPQFHIEAKIQLDMGKNTADDYLDAALHESLIEIQERPRPKTNPEKFFRRNGLSTNNAY